MKKASIIFLFILLTNTLQAQSAKTYGDYILEADSLYNAKSYTASTIKYTEAFKANNWLAYPNDRYNAACSWALCGGIDSAFNQLQIITLKSGHSNYGHISTDSDLNTLHADPRWAKILASTQENKDKEEANLDKPLVALLDGINHDDQYLRLQLDSVKKYGYDSQPYKEHWKKINYNDSINLIKIKKILDERGWLGADIVGKTGNQTLFLVIQHSDQATQEYYLPILREAFKTGKAQGSQLALLEDRVALAQGKLQLYGSQIGRDTETNLQYVLPLADPDNVAKRRAEMGMTPMKNYVKNWNLVWDVEEYKINLPKYIELFK
jgi:hypothetical protein